MVDIYLKAELWQTLLFPAILIGLLFAGIYLGWFEQLTEQFIIYTILGTVAGVITLIFSIWLAKRKFG